MADTLMQPGLALSLLLSACAPHLELPPIGAGSQCRTQDSAPPVTVPASTGAAPAVKTEYDAATGFTRRSVTTHRGVYTGWVSKPQLTFFALGPGKTAPTRVPASIGLVFRTLEPQAVRGTSLILSCAGRADSIGLASASYISPTGNTHSHFLTYMIPAASVARFASCEAGVLDIAQLHIPFDARQLSGLRALLLALGAQVEAGSG
jgi:hypothetical protein